MNNLTFIAYRPDRTTYCNLSYNCIQGQKGSDFVFEDKRTWGLKAAWRSSSDT